MEITSFKMVEGWGGLWECHVELSNGHKVIGTGDTQADAMLDASDEAKRGNWK